MSKKKIDQTMTEARNARQKKAREAEKQAEATVELLITKDDIQKVGDDTRARQEAQEATKNVATGKKATRHKDAAQDAPDAHTDATESAPDQQMCVFAFRLRPEERDAIHRAAGAARASKFARTLLVAAARGDEDLVGQIVKAVKESAS